jgi:hypothetical protein
VLAGSCLGGAAGATSLVQSLLPFAREHAAAEWQQLCQLAVRQAKAEGRRLVGGDVVAPWDVAYTSLNLVSAAHNTSWSQNFHCRLGFGYQECCRLHGGMRRRLAVRQARAEGRRVGVGVEGGDVVAPWDVAYTFLSLVSAAHCSVATEPT